MTDAALVRKIRQGDPDTVQEFLDRFHKQISAIAWLFARQSEDARDLACAIRLHLIVVLRLGDWDLREHGSFSGFVVRTARNKAIDWCRRNRRGNLQSLDELRDNGWEFPATQTDPLRLAAIQAVRDCLDRMRNARHRLALELQMLGLDHPEIAEIFRVKPKLPAVWVNRGRGEIKPCLEKSIARIHADRL